MIKTKQRQWAIEQAIKAGINTAKITDTANLFLDWVNEPEEVLLPIEQPDVEQLDDGWIAHDGVDQPVADTKLKVRFRNGAECETDKPQFYMWKHYDSKSTSDIIAYKILEYPWHEHDGKGMPVAGEVRVDVEFDDGKIIQTERAAFWKARDNKWVWSGDPNKYKIKRWRLSLLHLNRLQRACPKMLGQHY